MHYTDSPQYTALLVGFRLSEAVGRFSGQVLLDVSPILARSLAGLPCLFSETRACSFWSIEDYGDLVGLGVGVGEAEGLGDCEDFGVGI